MNTKDYFSQLPKKAMAAGVLLYNSTGSLLIVKPLYREGWLLPGGMVEKDESPRSAIIREVREELNLDITPGNLICVDYKSSEGEKLETLQFIFNGGVLSDAEIDSIRLQEEELKEFKFLPPTDALTYLNGKQSKRIQSCLESSDENSFLYLEDGQEPI